MADDIKLSLIEAIPLNNVNETRSAILRFEAASKAEPAATLSCEVDGSRSEVPAVLLDGGEGRWLFSAGLPRGAVSCELRAVSKGVLGRRVGVLSLGPDELSDALEARFAARMHAQEALHHEWMLAHQLPLSELQRQRDEVASWPEGEKPLISLVTPVFRPKGAFLRQMIDSVLAQTYDNFELVLANASGECEEVDRVLDSVSDPRVRVVTIPNIDISANTNAAIAEAKGDYVGFIDHDDFIEPEALYRYVCRLHEDPDCDLMFCDEDLFEETAEGWRFTGPRFKPGWNPDLVLTHNYVCHLLMVSRRALELTERSDSSVNAAQDYDLTLKVAEIARSICHVPELLYHWRVHQASTALNRDSKPYALEAGRLAVEGHVRRVGPKGDVWLGAYPFSYRVNYRAPDPDVSASLLIACPNADEKGLVRALRSIRGITNYPEHRYEFVVALPSAFFLRAKLAIHRLLVEQTVGSGAVTIVRTPTTEPAAMFNAAAAAASNEMLVLLDDRSEAPEDCWLRALLNPLRRDNVAAAGSMLLAADGLLEAHGMVLRPDGSAGRAGRAMEITDPGYMSMLFHARDVDVLPARGLAVRRLDWDELGGLDPSMGELAVADLCLKLRERGGLLVSVPYDGGFRVHESLPAEGTAEQRARLLSAHPAFAGGDEYLGCHIDPWSDNFGLEGSRA